VASKILIYIINNWSNLHEISEKIIDNFWEHYRTALECIPSFFRFIKYYSSFLLYNKHSIHFQEMLHDEENLWVPQEVDDLPPSFQILGKMKERELANGLGKRVTSAVTLIRTENHQIQPPPQ
jgi:hypothetical protein